MSISAVLQQINKKQINSIDISSGKYRSFHFFFKPKHCFFLFHSDQILSIIWESIISDECILLKVPMPQRKRTKLAANSTQPSNSFHCFFLTSNVFCHCYLGRILFLCLVIDFFLLFVVGIYSFNLRRLWGKKQELYKEE